MNKVTKVSLVPILASCLLAATAIAPAQAAKHHRQAATACAAKPGTMGALFCPAPRGPRKTVASSAR
jgi:hypothetical protein